MESLLLFSLCPHSGPSIALFLTCKMKGSRGQHGQGNESFLIPLAWSHSTGFLLYHGSAQGRRESALLLAMSQLWGPISRLPGNSWVHGHPSLAEVAMVTSPGAVSPHALREQCSCERKAPSSPSQHHAFPEPGFRLHRDVHGLLHCATSKSAGIFLYPLLERTLII